MNSTGEFSQKRASSLLFPLFVFSASRCLLFVFAKAGPLFGHPIGADAALAPAFRDKYPTLAALAHGDIANFARIARDGYAALSDVTWFPLLPWLGKGLGAAFGSIEVGLSVASLLLCALGFVGVYRAIHALRGPQAARWGLGLLAAFPLSYHLSDGSALPALLAFSAWAMVLAMRGRALWAGVILSLGVLVHPLCVFSALALAWPPTCKPETDAPSVAPTWARVLAALLPVAALVTLLSVLGTRFHSIGGAFRTVFLHSTPRFLTADWVALLAVFGTLLAVGVLLLARTRELRPLALASALQLLCALGPRDPVSGTMLAACWPAFIVWGDWLGRRESLRGPVVAMLATHQGLLLYCFTHFLHFS
jgi:hypothetical protein